MESSRLFVSNLSPRTTEHDLQTLFQDYGTVERVELKKKTNLTDEAQANVIAFVTLSIDPNDLEYCINELKYRNLHGARFRVSVAKESFLDRLKRERDEAAQAKEGNEPRSTLGDSSSELLQNNYQNRKITFPEDEKLYDFDNVDASLLITKKRAANSMQNGKISIEGNIDASPLHIIQQKKKEKHQPDSKSFAAEEKRIKSLKSMKTAYEQKKNAIQEALSSVNTNKSKKIKFDDAEDDDEASTTKAKQSKPALFSDDDENADDFEQDGLASKLPDYKGKKGERLAQIQSKQSLDPRFKISEKFVDDDDDDDEGDDAAADDETVNERDWQMGILEQVVGTKIDSTNDAMARNKRMLRYDPSKEEHSKYLRQDAPTSDTTSEQKQKQKEDKTHKEAKVAAQPAVSKEVFYVVTDTLQQSLKSRGDGFSLLNMFGNADIAERDDQLKKLSNEKILVKKSDKHHIGAANPFSYDSSSEEDEAEQPPMSTDAPEESSNNNNKSKKKQTKKVSLVLESFFVPKNDARLKEGAKFFIYTKDANAEQSYDQVRNRLKMLIRTKINKSKKHTAGHVGKKRRTKKIH